MFETKYKIILDRWNDWCLYKRNWWSPFWYFISDYKSPEQAQEIIRRLRTPPIYL